MACTRAKARALRDAINIGVVAIEELGAEFINGVVDNAMKQKPTNEKAAPADFPINPKDEGKSLSDSERPKRTRNPRTDNPPPDETDVDLMTENQRRFLFRLLAERGLTGDEAHDWLAERFNVESLKEATKQDASISSKRFSPEKWKSRKERPLDVQRICRPDNISVSQINQYLMCPLKYRFNYIDKLPKPFRPAELALAARFMPRSNGGIKTEKTGRDRSGRTWYGFSRPTCGPRPWRPSNSRTAIHWNPFEKGKQLLAVYLRDYKGSGVRAIELPFRVPLVDLETGESLELPLDGYIDLIEADDTVVELKTAARVFDPTSLTQNLQLSAYAYAFGWLYKRKPTLRIDILTKTKNPALHSFEVNRDKDSLVRFFHIAKGVLRAIRERHFYPNEGWQCPNCEYFDICQKWRNR
jgi:putative RecB family exonuclease